MNGGAAPAYSEHKDHVRAAGIADARCAEQLDVGLLAAGDPQRVLVPPRANGANQITGAAGAGRSV